SGTSATISVGTAGKVSELLFEGVVGRRICISITDRSCTPGGCDLSFTVLTPTGTQLYSPGCLVQWCPWTLFYDTATLPATGTYAAAVGTGSGVTGSATMSVYDVPDDPVQFITLTSDQATSTPVTLGN